jgi:hypothetical protein
MIIARERLAEKAHETAAVMARNLGMHEHGDLETLEPGQTIMIASGSGIQMGTLTTRNMENMYYVAYKLNNVKIFEKRYLFNNTKKLEYDSTTTLKLFIDADAAVYVAGKN